MVLALFSNERRSASYAGALHPRDSYRSANHSIPKTAAQPTALTFDWRSFEPQTALARQWNKRPVCAYSNQDIILESITNE